MEISVQDSKIILDRDRERLYSSIMESLGKQIRQVLAETEFWGQVEIQFRRGRPFRISATRTMEV